MQHGTTGQWVTSVAGGEPVRAPCTPCNNSASCARSPAARERVFVYGAYLDLLARVGEA